MIKCKRVLEGCNHLLQFVNTCIKAIYKIYKRKFFISLVVAKIIN